MSLQKTIKEIENDITSIKHEISKYQHPEEKLQRARENYQDALNRRAQYIIDCHMKLQDLESQLKKPVEEYATKYQRGRRIISNPIAREVSRVRDAVSGHDSWGVDYHYKEMCERKDILDNFNGYMTDAEQRLAAAQENLVMYQELIRKSEEKKKPKKERPVHVININPYGSGKIEGYNVSQDDLREVAKNGARGISITLGDRAVSIQKSVLKDILDGVWYHTVEVNHRGLHFQKLGYDKHSSDITFFWKGAFTIYPEANIKISCLDKGGK
jgi:hypothetical protein